MKASKKEQNIQECQNIIKAVDGSIVGLKSIYNYFDAEFDDVGINDVDIRDGDSECFHDEFKKTEYLSIEVKNAHNKYVEILNEWHKRHSEKLTELLKH